MGKDLLNAICFTVLGLSEKLVLLNLVNLELKSFRIFSTNSAQHGFCRKHKCCQLKCFGFFLAMWYSTKYHLFAHSTAEGQLGYFQYLAMLNKPTERPMESLARHMPSFVRSTRVC